MIKPAAGRHSSGLSSPVLPALLFVLCGVIPPPVLAEDGNAEELGQRVADGESRNIDKRIDKLESQVRELIEKNEKLIRDREAELRKATGGSEQQEAKPAFSFGGYVKTNFIASSFEDGELSGDSVGRDFLVPSTIPVGGEDEGVKLDAHARESRFNFQTNHTIGNNHALKSFIQLDFLTTPVGNERVSNSFSPRLRHAFVKFDDLLVGQTWGTFMDTSALAESVTFLGASGSTSFVRQAQIRYSPGNFAIALENPETTVTPAAGGRIETDDNNVPDLSARYTWDSRWGHLQLAGILRQLKYENREEGIDDTTVGGGVSFSGKVLLGRDDIRWLVHYGDGLGRYVGLNFANDATVEEDGTLEAIGTAGGFGAYRHWWSQKWRSNLILSYLKVDNPSQLNASSVNRANWSGQLNLLYSPVPAMSFGLEYLFAEREIETRETGQLNQVGFMAKYAF